MIISSILLATNLGLVGLSMKRLRLHIQFNRANRNEDHQEALTILRRLQRLPSTPLGSSMCETLLLRTAGLLRDWALVDETWERYQRCPTFFRRFERETLVYYADAQIDRGYYKAGLELYSRALALSNTNARYPFDFLPALGKAGVLIRLGEFAQARAVLDEWTARFFSLPAFGAVAKLVRANLDYLEGDLDRARAALLQLSTDPRHLRHLQDSHILYALVRSLCRCELAEPARALFPAEPGRLSVPKSREVRMLAAASLAEAEQDSGRALSYYGDLKNLAVVDAEAYVRASVLCQRAGRRLDAQNFLEAALEHDPESHWAEVASRKLRKLLEPPA
mgnify:CR=1 FL=1